MINIADKPVRIDIVKKKKGSLLNPFSYFLQTADEAG